MFVEAKLPLMVLGTDYADYTKELTGVKKSNKARILHKVHLSGSTATNGLLAISADGYELCEIEHGNVAAGVIDPTAYDRDWETFVLCLIF